MNTRRLLAFVGLLGLMSLAFSPLGQEAPPRPAIRISTGVQTVSEDIDGYCWPVSADDNQCGFAAVPAPLNAVTVESGIPITVIIDNSPSVPSSVTASVSNAGGEQAYNLNPAEQTIFEAPLPPGPNTLRIDAVYDNVLGVQAFVSFVFSLTVLPASQGGAEIPLPTQEVFGEETEAPTEVALATEEPTEIVTEAPTEVMTEEATEIVTEAPTEVMTEEPTEVMTEEATQELPVIVTEDATEVVIPLPVVTEDATEEATEEPTEAVTEAPTEVMTEEPTEEATEVVTEAPTEVVTEEPTEEATEVVTEAPTEVVTEEPTEEATEEPTEAPTEVVTEEPTEEATEVATEAPTAAPVSPSGERPTFTTVPLQGASPSFTPTFTPTITQPVEIPDMQLVFAGRAFAPVGVNFCQRNAAGQRTCVESPLPNDSPTVDLLQNFAVQIRLVGSPRPAGLTFTFLDANTLQAVQSESRGGDQLVLFNINPPPGVYFLRVSVNWGGTDADYFFRVRINP